MFPTNYTVFERILLFNLDKQHRLRLQLRWTDVRSESMQIWGATPIAYSRSADIHHEVYGVTKLPERNELAGKGFFGKYWDLS